MDRKHLVKPEKTLSGHRNFNQRSCKEKYFFGFYPHFSSLPASGVLFSFSFSGEDGSVGIAPAPSLDPRKREKHLPCSEWGPLVTLVTYIDPRPCSSVLDLGSNNSILPQHDFGGTPLQVGYLTAFLSSTFLHSSLRSFLVRCDQGSDCQVPGLGGTP